jgi:hypothetical protein
MRAVSHQALTQKMVNTNYRDIIHTEVKNLMIKFYNRSSESFNPTNDLRFFLINLLTTILFGQKSEKLSLQIEQMVSEIAQILRPENGTIDKFPWLKYIPFVEKRLNRHAYKARDLARELFKHLLEDLRQKLKENENENSFAAHVLKNMNISSDIVSKPYEDSLENDDDELKKQFVFDEVDFMNLNNSFLIAGAITSLNFFQWIWVRI